MSGQTKESTRMPVTFRRNGRSVVAALGRFAQWFLWTVLGISLSPREDR